VPEPPRGIDRETLERAIETWGEEAQLNLAGEECSELDVALHRLIRGRADEKDVIEEIADVMVMMEQLTLIFEEDAIEAQVEKKMYRLKQRIAKANGETLNVSATAEEIAEWEEKHDEPHPAFEVEYRPERKSFPESEGQDGVE
jgi:NTP pyrophosphatase (non-canonical NTP hydrolase)